MTRSKRLGPLVRVSRAREEEIAKRLAEAHTQWQAERERFETLVRHRAEYAERLKAESARGVGAARLRQYQDFLERLDEALAWQQERLAQLERACEAERAAWFTARQRRRALDKAVERVRHAERREQDRREQAETDAQAARDRGARCGFTEPPDRG
jgi:flagellar FliJ protein